MRTIAIVGGKGGIGKTFATLSIATELGRANKRVLIADFDPSENSSTKLVSAQKIDCDASYLFQDKNFNIQKAIYKTSEETFPNIDILAGSDRLDFVDNLIAGRINTDQIFKRSLKKIESKYDYCIIDCPPNRGTLVINALASCDAYITPFTIEVAAIDGVLAIDKLIDWLIEEGSINRAPINLGAFCSDYTNPRSRATKKIYSIAQDLLGEMLLDIKIPTSSHVRESGIYSSTLQHDRKHKICIAYTELTNKISNNLI